MIVDILSNLYIFIWVILVIGLTYAGINIIHKSIKQQYIDHCGIAIGGAVLTWAVLGIILLCI
jgi:hypothetical protein